jgi:hypothetical protein
MELASCSSIPPVQRWTPETSASIKSVAVERCARFALCPAHFGMSRCASAFAEREEYSFGSATGMPYYVFLSLRERNLHAQPDLSADSDGTVIDLKLQKNRFTLLTTSVSVSYLIRH